MWLVALTDLHTPTQRTAVAKRSASLAALDPLPPPARVDALYVSAEASGNRTNGTVEVAERFLPSASPEERDAVLRAYTPARFGPPAVRHALYELGTDGYYACPTRRIASAVASRLPGSVFRYVFAAAIVDIDTRRMPDWARTLLFPLRERLVDPLLGAYQPRLGL